MELNEFLVNAKKNSYAGNAKELILADGGKELIYEEDKFKYRDRYYGFNPFFGQELVWKNNELIWGMNYYGRAIDDFDISIEEIYSYLKKALLKIPENAPFRGPELLKLGNYLQYINKFYGNVNSFIGQEEIYFIEDPMYNLDYHGGLIKIKNA